MLALFIAFCLIIIPATSNAGLYDLAKRAADWWLVRSAGALAGGGDVQPGEKKPGDDKKPGNDKKPGDDKPAAPGMCQVPQEPPKTECDIGSGFLCVSTPPGGVSDSKAVIRGTIDRQGSVLASIRIAVQNEYTKTTSSVDTAQSAESGCWDKAVLDRPFCLDGEGKFAAQVDLPENGPYTISVSASRLSGESVERKVRTSRVIAPVFDESRLALEPDVRKDPKVDGSHVMVTVSLLSDCQFCDFIGAATNGVAVSVENVIKDSAGKERRISCLSTVEQGGQGKFMVGVPVGAGQNTLTVRACNAAVESKGCPEVGGIAFTATGAAVSEEGVEFISPPPQPAYDSKEYPSITWKFKLETGGECVDVRFNRDAAKELCPDALGEFSIALSPKVGINVASIARKQGAEEFAWTFGWGSILSPHGSGGGDIRVPSSAEIGLPASTAKQVLLPLINNFLASDEFRALIRKSFGGGDGGGGSKTPDDGIAGLIPNCDAASGGEFTTAIRGEPQIESAYVDGLSFGDGRVGISLTVKGLNMGVDLIPKNSLPPLPLLISFREAIIDLALIQQKGADGKTLFLVSSPHDDCEFKAGSYCRHMPAPLVPANFVGGANGWGGFVRCDPSLAQGEAVDTCIAINALNAQTGVVSEKVLDAVNDAIYCGGSATLTRMARSGVDISPICIGDCGVDKSSVFLPPVQIPLGVSIDDGSRISSQGLLFDAGLSFGNAETYAKTPAEARIPSAGILTSKGFGARSFDAPTDGAGNLNLALSLDAVNALLFVATVQGNGRDSRGFLDIDVHEPILKSALDLDFVKECDEFTPPPDKPDASPPTYCNIRPRVVALLGSALTTYGYLPANHPLMVAVRGNRALPPRVAAVTLDELPVVKKDAPAGVTTKGDDSDSAYVPSGSLIAVEIGGLSLSFYALDVDEGQKPDKYGNLPIKLDSSGKPIIKSMRPEDPEPLNGQIISFDLSLLLGIEVGMLAPDSKDESKFALPVRILSERSRLVLTPIPGSNATTIPSAGLVSALAEQLKYALSSFSSEGEPILIPVPREFPFSADEQGMYGMLGLAKISFVGDDGLAIGVEPENNTVIAALTAAITQILHKGGQEASYTLP
ncbi:MAG: hypothetical protein WC956_06105 [bacterium]